MVTSTDWFANATDFVRNLFMSDIDSHNGIKITVDAPTGNNAMLSIKRPMCLRQEYGMNVRTQKGSVKGILRHFYGLPHQKNGYNQVGTLCQDQFTRPMPPELQVLSFKLMELVRNSEELKFINSMKMRKEPSSIDFKIPNHVSILIYFGLHGFKEESTLSYHCDNTYTSSGKFCKKMNTQTENTPTITITMGDDREINYRRRYSDEGKWNIDKSFTHTEIMKHGTIGIVHPNDEKPFLMKINNKERLCQYQHGNIRVPLGKLSIALVFRHVSTYSEFCVKTHKRLFKNPPSLKDEMDHERLHRIANKKAFQEEIQTLFKKVFD